MEGGIVRVIPVCILLLLCGTALGQLKTDIEYARVGETSLKLDVSTPTEGAGPFPVAIIIHGGGWSGGDKQQDITPLFKPLNDAGFVWFSINYRLAPANRWPACFDDVKTAIRWVKQHAGEYKGDPSRIVLFGHSAGGHLAFMAAQTGDTPVQAVVGLAPVTDFEQDLEQRGGLNKSLQDLLDRPQAVTEESRTILRQIGPINHIKAGLPPFLVLQGSMDRTVQPVQSQNFVTRLKLAGVDAELVVVDGAGHRVTDWDKTDTTWTRKMIDWLKLKVQSK